MNLRKGTIDDLEIILDELALLIENKHEGSNWSKSYPNRNVFLKDIEKGDLYVLQSNEFIGITVLNEEEDSNYKSLKWTCSKPLVIHRLFISYRHKGRGYGKVMLGEIVNFAKSLGYDSIRLDTNENNILGQKLYEGYGFEKLGYIPLEGKGGSFIGYELKL